MSPETQKLHDEIVALKEDIARLEADETAAESEVKSRERDVKLAEQALNEARSNEQTLYNAVEHRHSKLKYLYRDFFAAMEKNETVLTWSCSECKALLTVPAVDVPFVCGRCVATRILKEENEKLRARLAELETPPRCASFDRGSVELGRCVLDEGHVQDHVFRGEVEKLQSCTCKSTTPGYHGVLCSFVGRKRDQ